MKIAFIGLGIMGSRMAANLQAAGHQLTVHNRTKEKAQALIDSGALWADTPAQAVKDVEVLITMLAHPEAVTEAAHGENGFLDALPQGILWIDASTVNPTFSKDMAQQAHQRGLRFLDAPVSGTKGPAEKGELLFLVGGPAEDLQTAQPLFDIMGRKTVHVGGHGMGSSLKLVVNGLLAQAMLNFSEAVHLGRSLGITQEFLFDFLLDSRVVAPVVSAKRTSIESGSYEANFPLRWIQKDLRLAAESAQEQGVAIPLIELARDIYQEAVEEGLGDQDFAAVYQFINQK